jgi:hypothetical protein
MGRHMALLAALHCIVSSVVVSPSIYNYDDDGGGDEEEAGERRVDRA